MDIIPGIGSLKAAGDILKGAVQVATDLKQIDLVQKLIEVQQAVLEAQSQQTEMTVENTQLRSEIEKLQKDAEFKGSLVFDIREQLYLPADAQDGDHSRFCPHCLDAGVGVRRLIAVQMTGPRRRDIGLEDYNAWRCPACESYFTRSTPLPH